MHGVKLWKNIKKITIRRSAMRDYAMDFIPDKATFRAVMFARRMIREGGYPPFAISKAAGYYRVSFDAVAHYVAQAGGRARRRRYDNA
jgi:hypothetical protein